MHNTTPFTISIIELRASVDARLVNDALQRRQQVWRGSDQARVSFHRGDLIGTLVF
jgi:hypothetical protein